MGMDPKASVQMVDFPGLVDSTDRRDVPPGAAEVQVNLMSVKMAELQSRGGLRQVTFES